MDGNHNWAQRGFQMRGDLVGDKAQAGRTRAENQANLNRRVNRAWEKNFGGKAKTAKMNATQTKAVAKAKLGALKADQKKGQKLIKGKATSKKKVA